MIYNIKEKYIILKLFQASTIVVQHSVDIIYYVLSLDGFSLNILTAFVKNFNAKSSTKYIVFVPILMIYSKVIILILIILSAKF